MKYKLEYDNNKLCDEFKKQNMDGRWFQENLNNYIRKILKIDCCIKDCAFIKFSRKLTEEEIDILEKNFITAKEISEVNINELLYVLLKNKEYNAMNLVLDMFIL